MAGAVFAAGKGIVGGVKKGKDVFLDAKKSAKLSGKLLACSLALSYPLGSQTISLIGFSLGAQVTKSCIKTLHKIGACSNTKFNIIHNITLMGGAINFVGVGKEQKWRKIFGESVSGQIRNVYSTKDYILLGYSYSHGGKQTAGRNHLDFEQAPASAVHPMTSLDFTNYNVTNLADVTNGGITAIDSGHLNYRGILMGRLLMMVSFY